MSSFHDVRPLILAPFYINEYLGKLPAGLVLGHKTALLRRPIVVSFAASKVAGWRARVRFRPDVVHKTYYYPAGVSHSSVATVTTVHDMIHEKFPEGLAASKAFRKWKYDSVHSANRVICVSENTKRDLMAMHAIPEEKISVVYHGVDTLSPVPFESAGDYRRRVIGLDVPYLLFVGSRVGYKNFEGLLAAYKSSPLLHDNFQILCFGGGAFNVPELNRFRIMNIANKIKQAQGSDAELASAYSHATVLVYPSRYEGFGFPPIEAMSLSCPVACSQSSSLPEVVGVAAELFDPNDERSIRMAIESVIESSSRRAELIQLGLERCKLFSWKKCASDTVNVYREIV